MQFVDRYLKCIDCKNDFVFTAGEQLFFNDKQFKNDPKRCKLCKAKRSGLGRSAGPDGITALPFSRTETKAECSACGIETTVPFKPTQGRPVLCRACFELKRVPAAVAAVANLDSATAQVAAAAAALDEAFGRKAEDPVAPMSSAATMEMISGGPVSDAKSVVEPVSGVAEVWRA
jgi:CxxC-x17-CxxC domain-containing protein